MASIMLLLVRAQGGGHGDDVPIPSRSFCRKQQCQPLSQATGTLDHSTRDKILVLGRFAGAQ